MKKRFGCYLVCKGYIEEVRDFLNQFFQEERGKYSSHQWVTFKLKGSNFKINLMKGGSGEPLTYYMTFEIYFNSKKDLENFAKKHNLKIKSFRVTNTKQKYADYYVETIGPKEICKIEANYCEDIS